MVAIVGIGEKLVVIGKLAADPDKIVTLPCTCAIGLLLLSVIVIPPGGTGRFNVITPVVVCPPTTLFGFTVSDVNTTGTGVSSTISVNPVAGFFPSPTICPRSLIASASVSTHPDCTTPAWFHRLALFKS